MTEWIDVKKRLPSEGDLILAIYKSNPDVMYNLKSYGWFMDTIYSCRMDKAGFIIQSFGPIFTPTHWMPCPLPPEDL